MSLTLLGGVGTLLLTFVSFVIGVLALRSRRKDKEALDAREASELGIVMLQWSHRVRRLAATNGWDQDPAWPKLPTEATAEYLRGKAAASDNKELDQLLKIAQQLARPGDKDDH
jgi:hypothetical protein